MYCPSCDKTYGAIHSRCPECHSWLKVSAPSGSRAKSAKASASKAPAPPAAGGGVSTLPRENEAPISWADPAPDTNQWSGDSGNDWGTPEPSRAVAQAPPTEMAPSDSWGGGGGGGGGGWDTQDSSSSWGGGQSTSPAPAKADNSGWLNGGDSEDGWGGGGLAASPPSKSAPSSNGGGSGWLGDEESHAPPSPAPAAPKGNSSSWLNGGHEEPASPGRGWLGDGPAETKSEGSGWLNGESEDAPSMTEMVDRAINVEEDDEFVDDSWVDEEIRDNEFDELDVPEYVPPTPEVGGAFLKMALVAVLVILVGGGVLFLRTDSITPEEKAAQEAAKKLEFAQATIEGGKADLSAGRAELAVPQFEEALVALSDVNAPQDKIYQTEVLLCRSLMAAQDYREAYKHWKSIKSSGQKDYLAEAKKGLAASSRELRVEANALLDEGKQYAAKGEVNSVKRLGRDALDIYKAYGGNKGQLGKAHGIIGRGFFNGREYGSAQDHFKKAVKLAPGLGYEKFLADTNAQLRPAAYIAPMRQTTRRTTPRRPKRPISIGSGASYQKSNGARGPGRRAPRAAANSAPTAAPASPRKMKEVPIYRSNKRRSGSSKRKGQSGVLNTY